MKGRIAELVEVSCMIQESIGPFDRFRDPIWRIRNESQNNR